LALHAGVAWEWTDEEAARRDGEVRAALSGLAAATEAPEDHRLRSAGGNR
jgi:hypothetical protein